MSISAILKLAERFTSPLIQLDSSRCLNVRHPKAGCAHCVSTCPARAITMVDNRPHLEVDACIRCGSCLWECPVSVFDEEYPAESRLVTVISQQDAGGIELTCPAAAESVHYLAESVPVQTPRCLAALSPAMLVELAEVNSTLWLNDSACEKCPLAQLQLSIHRSVQTANAWLNLYRRPGTIRLYSQAPPSLICTGQKPAIVDGSRPAVDRRAFLRGKVQQKTGVTARTIPVEAANPVDERLTYSLPRERVRLLILERNWPPPPEQSVAPGRYGFAGIAIDEQLCTLCGWCAGFCPTAALEWWHHEDKLNIVFQPLRCLDCTICQVTCPVQAVRKVEQFPSGFLRDIFLLAEDTGWACTKCGNLTAMRQGELCIWCKEHRSPSADQLGFPWGTLFPPSEDHQNGPG